MNTIAPTSARTTTLPATTSTISELPFFRGGSGMLGVARSGGTGPASAKGVADDELLARSLMSMRPEPSVRFRSLLRGAGVVVLVRSDRLKRTEFSLRSATSLGSSAAGSAVSFELAKKSPKPPPWGESAIAVGPAELALAKRLLDASRAVEGSGVGEAANAAKRPPGSSPWAGEEADHEAGAACSEATAGSGSCAAGGSAGVASSAGLAST
jgi:hypothetical protein